MERFNCQDHFMLPNQWFSCVCGFQHPPRPDELFLPLYPAGGIAPISIFPFLNPYKCFCYKIFSCNSDNRLSLLYSSTGYGRNIFWEDTKDFSARTNNSSRWQVVGDCRIFKTGVNNYQKKRFSGLPGNFHFAHAVFRKQSIFFGSPNGKKMPRKINLSHSEVCVNRYLTTEVLGLYNI